MAERFVVHHHKTGRAHYDLRITQDSLLRCWSLLREPPQKNGDLTLAIERESFDARAADCTRFEEEAFGIGNVYVWDKGDISLTDASASRLVLEFRGLRLSGRYELRLMRWYPGNRWLFQKVLQS